MMADDGDDAADDERSAELSTIQAIYPELFLDDNDPYSAQIDISVEPLHPLSVRFTTFTYGDQDTTLDCTVSPVLDGNNPPPQDVIHQLSHLPPVNIRIQLPQGYPAEKAPSATVRSTWLSQASLEELRHLCSQTWEEIGHEQMIFAYLDAIREQADTAFGYAQEGEDPLELPVELQVSMLDFDLKAKRKKFEQETFECGICLEPKKGSACHRLSLCLHVSCVDCLQDYFNNCITEGDVGNVRCTAPDCGNEQNSGPDTIA